MFPSAMYMLDFDTYSTLTTYLFPIVILVQDIVVSTRWASVLTKRTHSHWDRAMVCQPLSFRSPCLVIDLFHFDSDPLEQQRWVLSWENLTYWFRS